MARWPLSRLTTAWRPKEKMRRDAGGGAKGLAKLRGSW
jgi:hypothetical protein